MSHIEEAIRLAKAAKAASLAQQGTSMQAAGRVSVVETGPGQELSIRANHYIDIDRERLRSCGLLPVQAEEHRIAKEYRAIKRGLLAGTTTSRHAPKAIMVASALAGEGKTFMALNLALSLAAERDWSVVLIDADVAKPRLSTVLGLKEQPGLLDLIAEPNLSLSDVLWGTNHKGLAVVPAGSVSENATELLTSTRARLLFNKARPIERTIFLFDSPPLLLTSESRALADVVEQILLVVHADETPRSAVTEAIAALGGRSIALVLNQFVTNALETDYAAHRYGAGHPPPE